MTHHALLPSLHLCLLVVQLQLVPARCYESVREVLGEIGEVLAVESVVRHLELGYMGRMDCIAQYR